MPSLVEIGPVVLEEKSKMWKVYRRTDWRIDRQKPDDRWSEAHLSFQLRWAKTLSFIWELNVYIIVFQILNSLHSWMLCGNFGWNWPTGSGEEDFKISSKFFCNLVMISPWKGAYKALYLNEFEFPSPKAVMSQVWLK